MRGNATLKIERAELDTEFLYEQLAKVRFHLVMAWTGGEMMREFAGARIVAQCFIGQPAAPNLFITCIFRL